MKNISVTLAAPRLKATGKNPLKTRATSRVVNVLEKPLPRAEANPNNVVNYILMVEQVKGRWKMCWAPDI
jgi:hypothetical protein